MSPQAKAVMQEAMMRDAADKFSKEDLAIRAPKPATRMQILKLQRHVNKPRGHNYLLQRGQ